MFKHVDMSKYITTVSENGWVSLDMQYFKNNPEEIRSAVRAFRRCDAARETLRRRYRNLNKDERPVIKCPKKGVAVRNPGTDWYVAWLNHLLDGYHEHYGDLEEQIDCPISSPDELDRFVSGKHERFQAPKMGMYAPYKRDSLTRSVDEYLRLAQENNADHMDPNIIDLALEAFDRILNVDLAGIPRESLRCKPAREAIYGSNVQGLATGLFQSTRDEPLRPEVAEQAGDYYDYPFDSKIPLAEHLIGLYESRDLDFSISENRVTNLKRVQVGGVEYDPGDLEAKIKRDSFKNAKYRTINANDPVVQIAEASAAISFREAVLQYTDSSFYNTLLDPDHRWANMERMHREAERHNVTMFPFDFDKHDARLHAEWMFNLMQKVVKPLYVKEDQHVIDIVSLALVYKIITSPNGKGGITFNGIIGALGSGDPWTNIIGTLGTRAIGWILHLARPDIFACDKYIGCNNGDDASYGVYKTAIQQLGIEAVIKIANDIVNKFNYVFNESKLISIPVAGSGFVNHWEQYAYWYNPLSDKVMRHGSTLRYFGKVYSDEDLGRQDSLEGLIDQLSTLNNTIGYVGDQTFQTTTFNVQMLRDFIKNDKILTSYVDQHGQAFFDHLVEDAVKVQLENLKNSPAAKTMSEAELREKAERKILHHLRAAGFDRNDLTRVIHDKDFSFLSIVRLIGLGSAELTRIAECGKGRNLTYRITNGNVEWLRGVA